MKADLLLQGYKKEDLKEDFGHSLTKLFAALHSNRKCSALKAADLEFRTQVRRFRDEFVANSAQQGIPRDLISPAPTNADIANEKPSAQRLIDAFGPLYENAEGLRYHKTGFSQSEILRFPPHADIPALYLSLFGVALADETENEARTEINQRSSLRLSR
ncbi:MAG: hypothetical protein AB3N17_18670 [Tateyamaria sp.]